MVTDTLTDLAREVDARCRLTGEFTLRSGAVSQEYFDKYRFEADPLLLLRVAEATVLSSLTGLPLGLVRKEAKTYGTCQLIEGAEVAGRRVVLVEDVISTGGAARAAAEELRHRDAQVDTVVCAIDRFDGETHP